jgi:hypothetical protein
LPEQTTPRYDRWSRPAALSPRGYVLAVLIPVLIAAAGFGALSLIDHSSDSGGGATVRLPTSDWIPGQGGGSSRIQGTLNSDEHRCVYLETADHQELWPIWPAGYIGKVDGEGRVSVYDGKDELVARDGQQVLASGSFTSASTYSGEACLPSDGDVAVVQSTVTAVG